MDKKISQFTLVTTLTGTELVPLAIGLANQAITLNNLSITLSALGNSSITKNIPAAPIGVAIPLTASLVVLPTSIPAFTLGAGSNGQSITLVSDTVNVVTFVGGTLTTITFGVNSTIRLVYITSLLRWIPESTYGVTLT